MADDAEPPRADSPSGSSTVGHSLDLPSLLPLSHNHPLLLAPTFDVDAFLLSRIHIPLDELRAELREYLGVLREELVQLINDDYEEFISLGTGLRGENDRLKRLKKPLGQLRADVTAVRDVLKTHQDAVQAKLDERAALREEKALLDLLQRLFDVLTRAESLQESSSSKVVPRLAGEYTQLVYLRDKAAAEGCAIVESVSPRINAIRTRLSGDLNSILTAALEAKDEAALKQCLKTYDLVEGWSEAEDVVRKAIRAFCVRNVIPAALTAPSTPTAPTTPGLRGFDKHNRLAEDSALAAVYNKVLAHIETYLPLLTIAHAVSPEFDFFSRVLWPEVGVAITDNLGHIIFAAGRPDELHKHYTTTHKFMTLFETYARTEDAVLAMRASDSYAAFERRWQLPVYFQLRWKEIVTAFEGALAQPSAPAASGSGFALQQSAAAWEAFRQCWAPEIYLPELSHRFWRLALQILSRYASWLQTALAGFKGEYEDETALKFAASAVADMDALRVRIDDNALLAELGGFPVELDTTPFADRIIGILQRRCAEPVKAVRSVASQIRTSAPKTITPSYFIPTLLKPLHVFFDARPGLATKHKQQWSTAVVAHVLGQFASILAAVRRTEDLVRRNRKSQKSGFSLFGTGSASTPDAEVDERLRKQRFTDVEALAKDARSLGVEVEALPTWTELRDVLDRADE